MEFNLNSAQELFESCQKSLVFPSALPFGEQAPVILKDNKIIAQHVVVLKEMIQVNRGYLAAKALQEGIQLNEEDYVFCIDEGYMPGVIDEDPEHLIGLAAQVYARWIDLQLEVRIVVDHSNAQSQPVELKIMGLKEI